MRSGGEPYNKKQRAIELAKDILTPEEIAKIVSEAENYNYDIPEEEEDIERSIYQQLDSHYYDILDDDDLEELDMDMSNLNDEKNVFYLLYDTFESADFDPDTVEFLADVIEKYKNTDKWPWLSEIFEDMTKVMLFYSILHS